jgi:CheY-like chemotaxis protein
MPNRVLIIESKAVHAGVLANMLAARENVVFHAVTVDAALRIGSTQRLNLVLVSADSEQAETLGALPALRKSMPAASLAVVSGDPRVLGASVVREVSDFVVRKPVLGHDLENVIRDATRRSEGAGVRPHLLVVENTFAGREAIEAMAEKLPYRLSFETTMEKALERLAWDRVSVVLVDIFMPGMGGIAGIQILRRNWPDLKVIAMTAGLEGEMTAAHALRAAAMIGANGTLERPFAPPQLRRVLDRCLVDPLAA